MAKTVVKLYIYELSNGLARQMSPLLLGKQIDGIWHTGVVCFGHEFFYGGGGIEYCQPGGTILGQPDEIINLGDTHIPEDVFMEYIRGLGADAFRADKYHLFEHNCNKFSNEVTLFLTGRKIPKHINDLPNDILNSAFGQMIKPIVDSMRVTPAGGSTAVSDPELPSSSSSHPTTNPSTTASKAQESNNPESIFEPRNTNDTTQQKQSSNQEYLPAPVTHKVEDITRILDDLKSDLGEDRTAFESTLVDIETLILKKKEVKISEEFVSSIEKLFSKTKELTTEKPDFLLNFLGVMKGLCLEKYLMENSKAQNLLFKLISELSVSPSKQSQVILVAALQVLCNAVSTKPGHNQLLSNTAPQPHISSVLTNCLLEGEKDVQVAASELTFNIARHKVSDDIAFECSTTVMELLTREPDKTITYYCLFSLHRFMEDNSEVPGLAKALDVDVTKFKGQSDQVDSLCQRIKTLMS